MTFNNGDNVLMTCGERTVEATILMISKNQVSAMLAFDAMIHGHAGLMPVIRHDQQRDAYRSIIDGTEITLREKKK
jgi:hypothetical protein